MAKTIGQLTQATTIANNDELVIEQSGQTKRVAASVVRGGLVNADIDAAAAIAYSKLDLDDSIVTNDLTDDAVTTAKIDDDAVTTAKIDDDAVTTVKIDDAAVTAAKLDGAQTGSAPIYGCRAWVNFDGTRNEADTGESTNGANVKLRASGNVASVLKNGVGDYTITFTTAMADANFAYVASINSISTTNATLIAAKYATTASSISFRIQSTANTNTATYFDMGDVCVAIFR